MAEYICQPILPLKQSPVLGGNLHKQEEVLTMFSDALVILDHNTVQYMIDEMQNTIDDQKAQLSDKDSQLAALKAQLLSQQK